MSEAPHRCFTVNSTCYVQNLDRKDRAYRHLAVHYQKPPVDLGDGHVRYSLNFPMLLVTLYLDLEQQQPIAEKVARILNKYWEGEE